MGTVEEYRATPAESALDGGGGSPTLTGRAVVDELIAHADHAALARLIADLHRYVERKPGDVVERMLAHALRLRAETRAAAHADAVALITQHLNREQALAQDK